MSQVLAKTYRGNVIVVPDWVDPEARLFGKQISTFLEEIGFPLVEMDREKKPLSYGKLGTFLLIRDQSKQPEHLAGLYRAFHAGGIEVEVYEESYVPDTDTVLIGISTK